MKDLLSIVDVGSRWKLRKGISLEQWLIMRNGSRYRLQLDSMRIFGLILEGTNTGEAQLV